MSGVLGPDYTDAEVLALQREVLPKYISFFDSLALDELVLTPKASVGVLGPIASSLVVGVTERLPAAPVHAFEPSDAGARAAMERFSSASFPLEVGALHGLPLSAGANAFTHAVVIHPLTPPGDRPKLLRELARTLVAAGQLVYALPLRGSYPEVADMLREYSLKHDLPKLAEAVEIAWQSRPTPETLTDEIERAGYEDVSVDVELLSVPFDTGRDFATHPMFGLVVAPDIASALGLPQDVVAPALDYVKAAIAKYWAEGQFDLTVNIGCATARKPDTRAPRRTG